MRRIVIDMQNVLFADAVAEALRNFDSNLEPVVVRQINRCFSLQIKTDILMLNAA